MDDFASRIEALEHRWMRAWIARNRGDMKELAARDMIVLFGADTPAILDRVSWLDATESRLRCGSYRFGAVYVRRHGKFAVFSAPVELDVSIDREPIMTRAMVTTVWRRTAVRRRWQAIERVIAGLADHADLPGAVRSMQLWR
ncbi:nuclear transport factor 2 family protein [Tsuneonella amylolytica]|uniref:nuclear transport factor 2 family protein n=1 Tax=Tsuneonella amylolytica TaxID=2338327 RepID=UPI000EA911AC|nr:nuclear transport factor 2 family protein [Tsuneonella amylolytica]